MVTSFAARRCQPAMLLRSRTMAEFVPALGTEEEMKKQAVEQIRARVKYQKELLAAKHPHDDYEEMWRWVNITIYIGVPVVVLSALYTYFFDEHSHRYEGPLPEYMAIRSKEYPWECGDCDLFDLECWKKCRAEKAQSK